MHFVESSVNERLNFWGVDVSGVGSCEQSPCANRAAGYPVLQLVCFECIEALIGF